MLLIEQGMLHTMTGAAPMCADMLIDQGKIMEIAPKLEKPAQVEVLDARGLHVWPGLMDAHTHLGLTEENPETADPADIAFAQAAAAGVTMVEVCPAPTVRTPRTCTLWRTGRIPERLPQPGALACPVGGMEEQTLRQTMQEAAAQGRRVKLLACEEKELALALTLAREIGGKVVLEHRAPTTALMAKIAASGLPVVISVARNRGETSVYSLAAQLLQQGVRVALSTDHPTARIHHLPLCAGLCLRYGVREEEAMATVTSNAALAMGLEQECGRIVPGGQADLTLLDGSPLRLATAVRYTLSGGRVIYRQEK